jgi:ABC-2 type transport system permease protein
MTTTAGAAPLAGTDTRTRRPTWPGDPFAGTGRLLRLALRRDRVTVPVSVLVLVATFGITVNTVDQAYGTQVDRDMAKATLGTNAAFRVLLGPLEHTQSVASMSSWRIGLFLIVVVAALAVMAVVRHTRKEEEAERLELVRAAPVGALASLVAGTIVAALLSLLTAVGVAAVLMVAAQAPGDVSGATAAGVQVLVLGLVGAGIGAVCAQIATASRTANSIGVVVFVAGYALRGIADARSGMGWFRWTNPVGWAQAIDPFGADNYWPALLCLGLTVVSLLVAARLAVGRDVGAGLVQPRPGPADGPHLGSPLALARRLQSGAIISWAGSIGAYCLLLGLILESADDIVGGNADALKVIEQLGGAGRIQDVMTALILGWIGIAAAAYTVTYLMQVRTEEAAGRVEIQLASGVSRNRYLAVVTTVSIVGVVTILVAAGVLMALGHGLTGGAWGPAIADAVGGAVVQIPAALVVGGLVVALYAWWPRLVTLGWAVITVTLLLAILGDALDLPQWVLDLSPFTHTPRVPLEQATALPLIVLALVAAALYAAAFVGFRRRDVPSA